ncbi:MAG: response regulator [Wenzhouxiangellaceae bacterium]|nr:response regulator [Wenzhouxiangellaceae bacterium]
MRLLLAEDDELLGDGVVTALARRGHDVDWLRDGRETLAALETGSFDLILLDLGLPRVDGMHVLKAVRAAGDDTPILILTARDAVTERVAGLDAGADDYLVKPFTLDELLARVRALLRRIQGRAVNDLEVGPLVLLPQQFVARLDGHDLNLSRREFQILLQLAVDHPAPASKRKLEQSLYGWDEAGSANAIEVHIHNLRRKLGADWIETERGIGYRLAPQ